MKGKKRKEIRIMGAKDEVFDIVITHAKRDNRTIARQAEHMLEELIRLKKLKPCR